MKIIVGILFFFSFQICYADPIKENMCKTFSKFAFEVVEARDAGVSKEKVLSYVVGDPLEESMVKVIEFGYGTNVTSDQSRVMVFELCMNPPIEI